MHHELLAIERQNMQNKIDCLQTMLKDMESDFAKCAQGVSPCFFCANDDTCTCTSEKCSNFKWQPHN